MVLSLVCLCAAVFGSLAEAVQAPGGLSLFACLPALLLAAGTGLILWVYVNGSPFQGNETLGERLTPRGKLALGLLVVGQLAELSTGQAVAPLKQFLPSGTVTLAVLGMLGLLLVLLGTGTAAILYRSGIVLLPREGPLLKRLNLPAKGSVLFLVLALLVVGLASLVAFDIEWFMSLLFLTLGIVTGFLALFLDSKGGPRSESAPWGISPRGWVSLGLLTLTAVTLATQDLRLLGVWGEQKEGGLAKSRAESVPVRPVLDRPTAYSLREPPPPLSDQAGETPEVRRMRRELEAERRKNAERGGKAVPSQDKRLSDLEEELAKARGEITELKAELTRIVKDFTTLKDALKPARSGSQ